MITMGEVDTSDLMMIITWAIYEIYANNMNQVIIVQGETRHQDET